eukprot:CAMPEP_0197722894 /NCGR_PEP_ID=MMETSP1434-20131217/5414_1 /TAXON_ID=265543 /ORGANISM="Minutocellus polymorphus, Strain CCMP3303" /LENGTH=87 /DNA_ID=CAMNT_0043308087 /DNA_START=131 /DNA_END=394 /DNA_ORIENTATION=-
MVAKTEGERRPPAVTLPPDTLSRTFAYLDIGDVPCAARVAKDWSQTRACMKVHTFTPGNRVIREKLFLKLCNSATLQVFNRDELFAG